MKYIHLFLINICAILIYSSCDENDIIVKEQFGKINFRSKEIENIIKDTENISFSISPELENISLTKEDKERINNLALKADNNLSTSQSIKDSISQQITRNSRYGFHEELIRIDNLQLIVALQWEAEFDLFADYNAYAQKINYADIHMSLNDAPYGYWFQIVLKGWRFEPHAIVYYGEGELCRYIENEEHMQLIKYTFFIEPRYNGYGEHFGYTFN